jgi:hypothetical protein
MGGSLLAMAPMLHAAVTGYQPPNPMSYGQTLTSIADPLQFGMKSPGQAPFMGAGLPPTAMPIGTSIASLQQLQMMDPQRFALLYGDQTTPYGGQG